MRNIEVNWKGVHKLLKGLNTFKATGADSIPAFILKAADADTNVTDIYEEWGSTIGKVLLSGQMSCISPVSKDL